MVETHNARTVGTTFVNQYYRFLHSNPNIVAEFYHDSSLVSRPDNHGDLTTVTTKKAIKDLIMLLDYKSNKPVIKTIDAQKSHQDGITVLVTGCFTGEDNMKKNFTQSFFLAPQEKGYYVQNDVLRYVEVNNSLDVTSGLENCTKDVKPKSVENYLASAAKKKKMETENVSGCSNRSSDHKDGSLMVATPSDEKVVGVESVQTIATSAVPKQKTKIQNVSGCSNMGTDHKDGSLLVANPSLEKTVDLESVQTNATFVLPKKMAIQNVSECNNTDHKDGSLLFANPSLENAVEMESVQHNATSTVKKKMEIQNVHKGGPPLVANPSLEKVVDVVCVRTNATSVARKKKMEIQKVSECSNMRTDYKDVSLLVANPSPEEVVDVESVQITATLAVKENVNSSECINSRTDLEDYSLLVEKPPLRSDMESVQNSAMSGVKGNLNSSVYGKLSNDLENGSMLDDSINLKTDVDAVDVQNNASLVVKKKRKKKKQRKKEILVASEPFNVDAELKEGAVFVEDPDATPVVEEKKNENPNALECSNIHIDLQNGSVLFANPHPKRDVDADSVLNNVTLKVKKKKRKKRKKDTLFASEPVNVDTELKEDAVLIEDPDATPVVEEKKNENPNASECSSLQIDLQDGSLLVGNAHLNRDVDVGSEQNKATSELKKKKKRKKENIICSEYNKVGTELNEAVELVENPDLKEVMYVENLQKFATLDVEKKKNENPNASVYGDIQIDLQEGSLMTENFPLKRNVDVENEQNNATLEVKKKKRKKEKIVTSEYSNVEAELKEDVVLVNNPDLNKNMVENVISDATLEVEVKRNENPNASESTSFQDVSFLVENPLKRDVDLESEQNDATLEVKKRKKRKKEKLIASEISNIDTELIEVAPLVENPLLKGDVAAEISVPKDAPLHVEEKKMENPNASGYSNVHTDLEDSSLLVENPSLKMDLDMENVQDNATVEVKKKKKKKKKTENVIEYSNVETDLKEVSPLDENPHLKICVDVENMQRNATLEAEEKEDMTGSENRITDLKDGPLLVENPPLTELIEVAPLVENPLLKGDVAAEISVPKDAPLHVEEKKMENPNASGYSNVHTDLEDSSLLVENPSLKMDPDMENVQDNATVEVKKKKKKKKKTENVIEYSNVETDLKEVSPLDENPRLKICVDVENMQRNATLEAEEKEDMTGSENRITDLKDGPLLVENPPLRSDLEMESAQHNATLEVKKKKRKKTENLIDCSDVDTGLKEGSPLNASSHLKQDGGIENAQGNATTEMNKKKTKRKKHGEQSTLEVSSIHNELDADSLLMENIFSETREVTVETTENVEALVCDKPKKRKKDKMHNASEEGNLLVEVENVLLVVEPRVESDSSLQTPLSCLKVDREVLNSSNIEENPGNENISTCPESKQQESKLSKKRRKLSKSVGQNLKPVEEGDETAEVPKDILMEEASVICADGQPASKKRKSRRKTLKEDDPVDSTQNNASASSIFMDNLDNRSLSAQNSIQIVVGDAVCVEKGLNDPSVCDPPLKLPEQKNRPVEHIGDREHFVSNLVNIEDIGGVVTKDNGDPPQLSLSSPERSISSHPRKKLLILDVNGLLADIVLDPSHGHKPDIIISGKQVFKRPFCDNFLQFCLEKFDVGVWSSRLKRNVDRTISFLMGNSRNRLLFCWDQSHCTHTGFNTLDNSEKPLVLKELRKLWDKQEPGLPWKKGQYNESNTLLLDDSPYKALRNPAYTAIFPESYRHENRIDCSLGPGGDLRVYLEGLLTADNVQDYVKQNPFGQKPITESDLSWEFYRKIASSYSKAPSVPKAEVPAANIC